MSLTAENSLQTRKSLLSRLRDHEDTESWQTFFDLYWRLLRHGTLRKHRWIRVTYR